MSRYLCGCPRSILPTMHLESLAAYLPALETTIDPNPILVAPGTSLLQVVELMNQSSHQHCPLPSNPEGEDLHLSDSASAVLVVERSHLVGIFTERDLVELTASQTRWRKLLIDDVMSQPVVTLTQTSHQSLLAALSMFREHQIRHLPVLDEQGTLLGLISSSSIRKALQPLNLLKWKLVRDVMTDDVISAPASLTVLELTQLMIKHRVSSIILTRSGEPPREDHLHAVGIVTERDIVQYQALDLDLGELTAESVMSTPIFSVKASDPLLKAQQLMQQRRIRRLVVTGKDGELKGIITQGNLLRVFDPLEMYALLEFLHETVERRTCELNATNQMLQAEIIEREKVASQLRETLVKEQELSQFRSYVTAMASHDLRLPLTNISLSAELLQMHSHKIPEEKKQQYLERIRLSVKQMNQLLNDILAISEVDAGTLQLNRTALDLVSFCESLVEELQLATRAKCQVQFKTQLPRHEAQADEKVLRQILVNLLSNAIKYSKTQDTVLFEFSVESDHVIFRIQDQGIGIPEDDQQRLFQPFYRASNASHIEGTGLGLAIVKRCVDIYEGAIALHSCPNQGTTFTIKLPLVAAQSQLAETTVTEQL